jgi:hypothetical protein
MADDDRGSIQVARQNLRKVLAREASQALPEPQQEHMIQPQRPEQMPALAPGRQARRGRLRRQVLARHGLEAHQHRGAAQALGGIVQSADQRLMSQMQSVEPAHGDGTAPVMRAQVRESSNKLHRHPRTEATKL